LCSQLERVALRVWRAREAAVGAWKMEEMTRSTWWEMGESGVTPSWCYAMKDSVTKVLDVVSRRAGKALAKAPPPRSTSSRSSLFLPNCQLMLVQDRIVEHRALDLTEHQAVLQ